MVTAACLVALSVSLPFNAMPEDADDPCRSDWGAGEPFNIRMNQTAACWREAKVLYDKDWRCYELHSQGPCEEGERLVYKDSICPVAACRSYTSSLGASCAPGTVSFDGECWDPVKCGSVTGQRQHLL